MCKACHSGFLQIRRGLVRSGAVPGARVTFGWKEFGCWACDGIGHVTDAPFAKEGAPAWNVYVIPHNPVREPAPSGATSEALGGLVQFGKHGGCSWVTRFGRTWAYSAASVPHFYTRLRPSSEGANREVIRCDFGPGHGVFDVPIEV